MSKMVWLTKDGNFMFQVDEHLREFHAERESTQEEVNKFVEAQQFLELRNLREIECFTIINRGQLWYDTLTDSQRIELKYWYQDWLNVTESKVIPNKPEWLN